MTEFQKKLRLRLLESISGVIPQMNMQDKATKQIKNSMRNIDAGAKASVRYTGQKKVTDPDKSKMVLLDGSIKPDEPIIKKENIRR